VNVIERAPHPESPSTIEAARREGQITKLMSDLEIAPLLLSASIDEHGRLRTTFVKHGLDLSRTLRIGGLSPEQPLGTRRTRELVAQLMRAVCLCADAGFYHGDLKPANIVLWLRRTGLDARLIDFDPQFLSSAEGDAGLLTTMRARFLRARLPDIACDALRCCYAVAMWGCLVLFLEAENAPREGELLLGRLQSATRHALTDCAVNPLLLQMLTQPEPPRCELVSVLGHYASHYLQLSGIADFFHELRRRGLGTSAPSCQGRVFSKTYRNGVSAAHPDGKRTVWGDWHGCTAVEGAVTAPTTAAWRGLGSLPSGPHWRTGIEKVQATRSTKEFDALVKSSLDAFQERQRDKDRARKRTRGSSRG
jgi:hypothetical protein